MKKFIMNAFIILLLISIYKDLTTGTNVTQQEIVTLEQTEVNKPFDVIKIKVEPGESVVTIIDKINPDMETFDIDRIIHDFQTLNPTIDPQKIQANRYYFFPKYKNEARN